MLATRAFEASSSRANAPSPSGGAWGRLVDRLLEATVVASWSRFGIAARRRVWAWPAPVEPGALSGQKVVVTGGTNGIGRATALALVLGGAEVCVVGRAPQRAEAAASAIGRAADEVRGSDPALKDVELKSVRAVGADLASSAAVAALVQQVSRWTDHLHALVHAAGLLSLSYQAAPSGTELTAAVHVVAPHELMARLLPLLVRGAPSKVVLVSSGGMYLERLDVDRLEMAQSDYKGAIAYARAKRAQVCLAHVWSARLAAHDIGVAAMHPGWVQTKALDEGMPRFARIARPLLRSPAEGADTVVWLAAGGVQRLSLSSFWFDRRPRSEHRWPRTTASDHEEQRLWQWCEEKTDRVATRALATLSFDDPKGRSGGAQA